jgi:hypothetical protein
VPERAVLPAVALPEKPAQPEAARPVVRAGFRRDLEARPSVAAARKVLVPQPAAVAQRLAQAERLAPPAPQAGEAAAVPQAQEVLVASAVQPTAVPGEAVALGVAAGLQPAAEPAGEALRPVVAAAPGVVAEVQRQAAGPAAAEAARLRGAEARDVEVPPRVARGGAQPARPSAAAWAALLCLQAARPAPLPRARSAHARKGLRIAQL